MKKLFFLFSVLSLNSFSALSFGGKYYSQIINETYYNSTEISDFKDYNREFFIGRCFSGDNTAPIKTALMIENRVYDNGPIGIPGDYITYGSFYRGNDSINLDDYNFGQAKYLEAEINMGTIFSKDGYNSIVGYPQGNYVSFKFRKSNTNDYIYAIAENQNGVQIEACYFFQNNH